MIKGRAHILGDDINTDLHCSSKYLPGKDDAYIAQHAFDKLVPGFSGRVKAGDIIVAGKNFGINSSREQAVHVLRAMGVAAVIARSFGRQFFRNAINNGLPVIECDVSGIEQDDDIEVDAVVGRVAVPVRRIVRSVSPLPAEVQAILAAGGLITFLQEHADWKLA